MGKEYHGAPHPADATQDSLGSMRVRPLFVSECGEIAPRQSHTGMKPKRGLKGDLGAFSCAAARESDAKIEMRHRQTMQKTDRAQSGVDSFLIAPLPPVHGGKPLMRKRVLVIERDCLFERRLRLVPFAHAQVDTAELHVNRRIAGIQPLGGMQIRSGQPPIRRARL